MNRTIMTNDSAFDQPNTGANEESLRMVSSSPVGNETVSDEELRAHVRAHLAGYKTPKKVVIVPKVPRAPNGKADYATAKQMAL